MYQWNSYFNVMCYAISAATTRVITPASIQTQNQESGIDVMENYGATKDGNLLVPCILVTTSLSMTGNPLVAQRAPDPRSSIGGEGHPYPETM